jgi:leucyl aminopeptidase
VITGEDLLSQNYPMDYAVGKAHAIPPRLIDLRWGEPTAPKVTLVGKGVCFDTGGLDIKSAAGMKLMKKDMGGAAQVLGLAQFIMALKVPVCLRVLIPAVENSIAGNAMRPLDILTSRKGVTVEVGNTDAEGRLVLADALWEACSEDPQLLIDCATLTGAARIAVGSELPAFFCNDEAMAEALQQAGTAVDDPLWQLPLYQPYRTMLDSPIADLNNISNSSYGGAITAALFLQEFVKPGVPWIHLDFMAYNLRSLPGRPEGGEAMGMRALLELIRQHVEVQPNLW